MTGKAQQRPVAAAACPEVVHLAEAHSLDPESGRLEAPDQQLLAARILGRNGWTFHKRLRKFNNLRQELNPDYKDVVVLDPDHALRGKATGRLKGRAIMEAADRM
jgi:hypothetical protein